MANIDVIYDLLWEYRKKSYDGEGTGKALGSIANHPASHSILGKLVSNGFSGGLLQGLGNMVNSGITFGITGQNGRKQTNGNGHMINIYPGGKETYHVYEEFVGICYGKNTEFKKALDSAINHCVSYQRSGAHYDNPSIVIITDRWCPEYYKKYEIYFIKYAVESNFDIHFLLVTDDGITEVPFLCPDVLQQLRTFVGYQTIEIPIELRLDELGLLPDVFEYNVFFSDSGPGASYTFINHDRTWHCRDEYGNVSSGKIKKRALRSFVRTLMTSDQIKQAYLDRTNGLQVPDWVCVTGDHKDVCGVLDIFGCKYEVTDVPQTESERILKDAAGKLMSGLI